MSAVRPVGVLINGMPYARTVGMRIYLARTKARLTQGQLAEKIGVATNTVSRWETGTYNTTHEQLYWVAWALGLKSVRRLLPNGGRVG